MTMGVLVKVCGKVSVHLHEPELQVPSVKLPDCRSRMATPLEPMVTPLGDTVRLLFHAVIADPAAAAAADRKYNTPLILYSCIGGTEVEPPVRQLLPS